MFGNGAGASEIGDNDKNKSVLVAVHIKPKKALRIGGSYYHDILSKGAELHSGKVVHWRTKAHLFTGSLANFGKKVEVLAESTMGFTNTDSTGTKRSLMSYAYAGYKVSEKVTPYVRYDNLHYQVGELGFHMNNTSSYIIGARYQLTTWL
jgi:hypothetical protein